MLQLKMASSNIPLFYGQPKRQETILKPLLLSNTHSCADSLIYIEPDQYSESKKIAEKFCLSWWRAQNIFSPDNTKNGNQDSW